MAKGHLFEYAVLFHPKPRKVGDETQTDPTEIVVAPSTLIATDEGTVSILVARQIPEKYLTMLDQVEILIRPFG